MTTKKYVYWQDEEIWLGYLQEYPDYWTQAETENELKEMLLRCRPELVLVYGQGFPEKLEELASIKRYPHRLTQVHQRINSRK